MNCVTFHKLPICDVADSYCPSKMYPIFPYSRDAVEKQLHSQQLHFQTFIKSRKGHVNESGQNNVSWSDRCNSLS